MSFWCLKIPWLGYWSPAEPSWPSNRKYPLHSLFPLVSRTQALLANLSQGLIQKSASYTFSNFLSTCGFPLRAQNSCGWFYGHFHYNWSTLSNPWCFSEWRQNRMWYQSWTDLQQIWRYLSGLDWASKDFALSGNPQVSHLDDLSFYWPTSCYGHLNQFHTGTRYFPSDKILQLQRATLEFLHLHQPNMLIWDISPNSLVVRMASICKLLHLSW